MELQEKLDQDLKNNLKKKNDVAVQAIRMIKSEYPKYYKKTSREIDDATIFSIMTKFINQEKIRLAYENGLIKDEKDPMTVIIENSDILTNSTIQFLETYIPDSASEGEIYNFIKNELKLDDYNPPMSAMKDIKSKFPHNDGKQLKNILMDCLR